LSWLLSFVLELGEDHNRSVQVTSEEVSRRDLWSTP
jgi:hypothetical protein